MKSRVIKLSKKELKAIAKGELIPTREQLENNKGIITIELSNWLDEMAKIA